MFKKWFIFMTMLITAIVFLQEFLGTFACFLQVLLWCSLQKLALLKRQLLFEAL